MWADTETDIDYLNYAELAELIAEMIERPDLLPLSLGVFGSWGVGKSSTLRLVESELAKNSDNYLIVKFDAWLYQDFDDARAALMSVVANALLKAAPTDLKSKARRLLGRINKLRALGLLVEGGALAMGAPTFGFLTKGVESISDVFSGRSDDDDVKAIKDAAGDAKDKAQALLKPEPSQEPPEEIEAFRKEFGEVLIGLKRTLVVFIDNLDRCLPQNAIHTLEAIRLFLFMPNTAFVISADEDMIRHAVSQHFKEPGERHVTDYLDKLIQVPVRVPRVGVQEVRAYLFLLFAKDAIKDSGAIERLRTYLMDKLQQSWKGEEPFDVETSLKVLGTGNNDALRHSLEMADRMAPLLAQAARVQGNPRIVKRLLNVVRMRTSIAKKREMPLDETVIAKLALFERCTDASATEALHDAINLAPGGKLTMLQLPEGGEEEADYTDQLPAAWQKHLRFIANWAQLDPKLSDIDLRPAVYLARETVPLRYATSAISAKVTAAVGELAKVATLSSTAAASAIAGLEANEPVIAMEQLVSIARGNTDWSKARSEARGMILLARSSAEAAKVADRYLHSLPAMPPWLKSLLKSESWIKD